MSGQSDINSVLKNLSAKLGTSVTSDDRGLVSNNNAKNNNNNKGKNNNRKSFPGHGSRGVPTYNQSDFSGYKRNSRNYKGKVKFNNKEGNLNNNTLEGGDNITRSAVDNKYDFLSNSQSLTFNSHTPEDLSYDKLYGGLSTSTVLCNEVLNTQKRIDFSYFGSVKIGLRSSSLDLAFDTSKCMNFESFRNSLGCTNTLMFEKNVGNYTRIKSFIPGILVPRKLWASDIYALREDFKKMLNRILDGLPQVGEGISRRQVIAWITKTWGGEVLPFPQHTADILNPMEGTVVNLGGMSWKECFPISAHTFVDLPKDGVACIKPNISCAGTKMEEKVLWLLGAKCKMGSISSSVIKTIMINLNQSSNYYYIHPYQNLGHIHIHKFKRSEWKIGNYILHPHDLKQIGQLVHDSRSLTRYNAYQLDLGYPMSNYHPTIVSLSIAVYLWGLTINHAEDIVGVNCTNSMIFDLLNSFEDTVLFKHIMKGVEQGLVYIPKGLKVEVPENCFYNLFIFQETEPDPYLFSGLIGTKEYLEFGMTEIEGSVQRLSSFSTYTDDIPFSKKLLLPEKEDMFSSTEKVVDGELNLNPAVEPLACPRGLTLVINRGMRKAAFIHDFVESMKMMGISHKYFEIGCSAGGFMDEWERRGAIVKGLTLHNINEVSRTRNKHIIYGDAFNLKNVPTVIDYDVLVIDLATGRGIELFLEIAEKMGLLLNYIRFGGLVYFKWKGVIPYLPKLLIVCNQLNDLRIHKVQGSRAGSTEYYLSGILDTKHHNYNNGLLNSYHKLVSDMNSWIMSRLDRGQEYYQQFTSPNLYDLENTWANQPIVIRVPDPKVAVQEWTSIGPIRLYKDSKGFILTCTPQVGRWELMRLGLCYSGSEINIDFDGIDTQGDVKAYDNRVSKKLIIDDHNALSTTFKIRTVLMYNNNVIDVGGGDHNYYHNWLNHVISIDPLSTSDSFRFLFQDFLDQGNIYPTAEIIVSTQSTIAWKNINLDQVRKVFPNVIHIWVQLFIDLPDKCVLLSEEDFTEDNINTDFVTDRTDLVEIEILNPMLYYRHKGVLGDGNWYDTTPWRFYDLIDTKGIITAKKLQFSKPSSSLANLNPKAIQNNTLISKQTELISSITNNYDGGEPHKVPDNIIHISSPKVKKVVLDDSEEEDLDEGDELEDDDVYKYIDDRYTRIMNTFESGSKKMMDDLAKSLIPLGTKVEELENKLGEKKNTEDFQVIYGKIKVLGDNIEQITDDGEDVKKSLTSYLSDKEIEIKKMEDKNIDYEKKFLDFQKKDEDNESRVKILEDKLKSLESNENKSKISNLERAIKEKDNQIKDLLDSVTVMRSMMGDMAAKLSSVEKVALATNGELINLLEAKQNNNFVESNKEIVKSIQNDNVAKLGRGGSFSIKKTITPSKLNQTIGKRVTNLKKT